jgi:uncharacterized protein
MPPTRTVRVAVSGDLHFDNPRSSELRRFFDTVAEEAEMLALVGDLTTHGEPEQMRGFVEQMGNFDLPVVTVLGNHDFEAQKVPEIIAILRDRGVEVLDGDNVVLQGVGFAGVKGFGGGFGKRALGPFGEPLYKQFVQEGIDESLKLENALRTVNAEVNVCLLHYAPITGTLEGEPEAIFPFLGTSRLAGPIDTYQPDAVFHGHAHIGALVGETAGGVPVFNVAAMLLERHIGRAFRIWEAELPDRRTGQDGSAENGEKGGEDGEERAGSDEERS